MNYSFTIREKGYFRRVGVKERKKYYFYVFPKNAYLMEKIPHPKYDFIWQEIPKYDWQAKSIEAGKYTLPQWQKLKGVTLNQINATDIKIREWTKNNPRHRYLVLLVDKVGE